MKSWINKVLFFSSNSIFFILLTRSNFFHIHTGNGLEEVLENQESRKERREREETFELNVLNAGTQFFDEIIQYIVHDASDNIDNIITPTLSTC